MNETYISTEPRVDVCGCGSALSHVARMFGLWNGDRGTASLNENAVTMRESCADEDETDDLHYNGL